MFHAGSLEPPKAVLVGLVIFSTTAILGYLLVDLLTGGYLESFVLHGNLSTGFTAMLQFGLIIVLITIATSGFASWIASSHRFAVGVTTFLTSFMATTATLIYFVNASVH